MLCIFTPTGHTYTFRDVEVVVDNESMLIAEYTAMSDGRRKRVTVIKSAIVAYSVLAPAEEQASAGTPGPAGTTRTVPSPAGPGDQFGAVVAGVTGFVTAAGGGTVELSVDRNTMNYPTVGSRVRVLVGDP